MTRLFLVEEQTVFREMLAEILANKNYAIVGQSGNGQDALKGLLAARPDLAIINPMLPGLNGLELLKRLKKTLPSVRALIFTKTINPVLIKQALEAGANGLVEKSAGLQEFLNAIRAIANGGTYFGQSNSDLAQSLANKEEPHSQPKHPLTAREREVLQLIAEGNRTKDMAEMLHLSIKTIDNHRTNMMRKLDLHNIASLTRYAIENGMIEVENLN